MEEKLKEILDDYEGQISKYEKLLQDLDSKLAFYIEHKFEEEVRMIRVKYDTLNMAIYRWRKMQNELKDVLNAWNS